MKKPPVQKLPYVSFAGKGIDVASKRADDLDKLCLSFISERENVRALDIGCGAGGQSARMALAGAQVQAIDEYDFSDSFAQLRTQYDLADTQLHFIQSDIESCVRSAGAMSFDIAVFQRTIHYFSHAVAKQILQNLHAITNDKLFISVTGIQSAVGEEYLGHDVPITERFFALTEATADTFSIHQPVCLYTEVEFRTLLEETGWNVERLWVSAFGNIKAVCS